MKKSDRIFASTLILFGIGSIYFCVKAYIPMWGFGVAMIMVGVSMFLIGFIPKKRLVFSRKKEHNS